MPDIQITAHDGGTFKAYIAMPEVTPAPAVIMIQEIFGINAEMREKCDHMAAQGYVAICPDLFWRIEPGIELVDSVPEQLERAFQLFGEFDVDLGVKDLQSTLDATRAHDSVSGKVGCVGYCLGGKLSYMLGAASDIDASVSYYGVGLGAMLDQAPQIENPILLHIAGADEFVPPEEQAQIQEAMAGHDSAEVWHYEGMDHAFARGNGMHYNAQAATLANGRTDAFLASALKNAA